MVVAVAVAAAGCGDGDVADSKPTHDRYAELLERVGADDTLLGRVWLDAAERALLEPTPIELPYAETGGFLAHEPRAVGLAFEGIGGQKLTFELTRSEAAGRIYAELFRVETLRERTRHVWLAVLPLDAPVLELELPEDATYVLRVQPELLTDAEYRITLELAAALPFPITGFASDAVQSFFGAARDAGARHHEGVDIFVPRSTPVVAVAEGIATPRVNRLGGNTIWLSTPGTSYYYAHLERAAIDSSEPVRAGDVLGYVGNSGNAAQTVPHLHFGVYRWGKGAVDPLPLLGVHHFDGELSPVRFAPRYVRTLASELNLRRAPSLAGDVIDALPENSIVHAFAASGDWLHVRLPESGVRTGWIHRKYQAALEQRLRIWHTRAPTFLRSAIDSSAVPVDFVAGSMPLEVLAERDRFLLLRNAATSRAGWAANDS